MIAVANAVDVSTRSFQHDDYGPGGIIAGLREALANPGTLARFEVADHPRHGQKVYLRVAVGFELDGPEGRPSWHYAGEGARLDGAGSHALIPSWHSDQSIEHAAAWLACALSRWPDAWIFRQPAAAPIAGMDPVAAEVFAPIFRAMGQPQ